MQSFHVVIFHMGIGIDYSIANKKETNVQWVYMERDLPTPLLESEQRPAVNQPFDPIDDTMCHGSGYTLGQEVAKHLLRARSNNQNNNWCLSIWHLGTNLV